MDVSRRWFAWWKVAFSSGFARRWQLTFGIYVCASNTPIQLLFYCWHFFISNLRLEMWKNRESAWKFTLLFVVSNRFIYTMQHSNLYLYHLSASVQLGDNLTEEVVIHKGASVRQGCIMWSVCFNTYSMHTVSLALAKKRRESNTHQLFWGPPMVTDTS